MTTTNTVGEIPDVSTEWKSDETMWTTFCHLGGLFGMVFRFGNILAPLVIWLMDRDKYPLVDDQGKKAVNFQIRLSNLFDRFRFHDFGGYWIRSVDLRAGGDGLRRHAGEQRRQISLSVRDAVHAMKRCYHCLK